MYGVPHSGTHDTPPSRSAAPCRALPPFSALPMRVATAQRLLTAEPGSSLEVPVDVVNTGELIDGVTARVIGLPDARITVAPELLPLFPDGQGQLTLSIEVPSSQPAGMHPLTIEVISHGTGEPSQHVDIDLSVAARPGVRLTRTPQVQRARRSARFELFVENTGNVGLDVSLSSHSGGPPHLDPLHPLDDGGSSRWARRRDARRCAVRGCSPAVRSTGWSAST